MVYAIISQTDDTFQCLLTSENKQALVEIADLYEKEAQLDAEVYGKNEVETVRIKEMRLRGGGRMTLTEERTVTHFVGCDRPGVGETVYHVVPAEQLVPSNADKFPVNLNLNPAVVQNLIETEQLLTIN